MQEFIPLFHHFSNKVLEFTKSMFTGRHHRLLLNKNCCDKSESSKNSRVVSSYDSFTDMGPGPAEQLGSSIIIIRRNGEPFWGKKNANGEGQNFLCSSDQKCSLWGLDSAPSTPLCASCFLYSHLHRAWQTREVMRWERRVALQKKKRRAIAFHYFTGSPCLPHQLFNNNSGFDGDVFLLNALRHPLRCRYITVLDKPAKVAGSSRSQLRLPVSYRHLHTELRKIKSPRWKERQ